METPENRIPVLIKELSHRNKDVRWAAAVSLSRIGKPAVEPLIAALDDRDSVVRLRAAWALGRIGDGRAAGKLVRTLLDGDWAVRMRAADALGALRAPEATDHLLLLLRDRNADVRRHAIAALTKIADPAAADRLGDTLKDPDWRVRMGAALALAAIGDDKSRGYLRTVSCDENEYVRTVALSSLKTSEGDSCRKTVKLGLAKDLPEGSMKGVRAGTLDLLLAHPDTGICAIGNTCTHQGCRLSTGTLEGSTVHCPCHGSAFDVKTGEVVNGPAKTPVPSYPVVLENGEITLSL